MYRYLALLHVGLVWQIALISAAFAIGLAAYGIGARVVPVVFSARSDIAALGGVSVGQLVAQDTPAIESLEEDLAALEVKLDPAVDVMRWVGRFSGGAAWVPMLTRELASWDRNATRVRRDLAAATRMLSSSTYLLDDYDLARSKPESTEGHGWTA